MSDAEKVNTDFAALAEEFAGKWVALDPESGDVVAYGDSALSVLEAASAKGVKEPIINRIFDNYGAFAPWLR